MARIDHVAVESPDPDAAAAFYERVLGARVVRTEGHPVAAYLGNTGFAIHGEGHARPHTGIRVSEEEMFAFSSAEIAAFDQPLAAQAAVRVAQVDDS